MIALTLNSDPYVCSSRIHTGCLLATDDSHLRMPLLFLRQPINSYVIHRTKFETRGSVIKSSRLGITTQLSSERSCLLSYPMALYIPILGGQIGNPTQSPMLSS